MIIIYQKFNLFDFKNSSDENVLQYWADRLPLQKRDRGRLDSKIDMLKRVGDNLPPKLLQPTRARHIMEIAVNGQVALRVLLCRGPIVMKNEFTFLFGATEKDRKYNPKNSPERADRNRDDLILNPSQRCKHERFNKSSEESIQR
jgi:hypothetical protein